MAVTGLRGRQILDDSVVRGDLNTTTAGDAVIRKIIAGTGISISSTGVDAGTGDVTISTTATILNGTGFVRMSGTTVSYVTGSAASFVKADGSLDGNVYALSTALNNYLALAGGTLTGQLINTRANATGDGTGQIYLNGANGNRIDWGSAGIGAPTFTTRSVGTKLVLYAGVSATSADYGIGIDNNTLWFSVPTTSLFFRFYGGTTVGATLTGAGALTLSSTATATQFIRTGGTSTQFLKADGSVDSSTYMVNPMTTIGDIIYGGAAGAATRLAAGTAGQALVSAGAAAPIWTTLTLENLPDAWVKRAVKAATTANITLSGTQTIDGIALVAGDRVLVKDQTAPAQNGIYVVAAGAWSRAADADSSSELTGAMVAVDQGTVNGGITYDNDFRSTDTLGTTGMTWNRVIDSGYTIPATQGGTGQTVYAVGDLLYASTTTALSRLAGVATGNVLISGGVNTAPSWGKVELTTHISGTLAVGNGGTGATTLTGVMVGNGTAAVTAVAGTASQLLRRNAGNTAYEFFTPTYATASGTTNYLAKFTAASTLGDSVIQEASGNIGLGVSPVANLHIFQSGGDGTAEVLIEAAGVANPRLTLKGAAGLESQIIYHNFFNIYSSDLVSRFFISSAGNVLINSFTDSGSGAKMQVTGAATVSSSITANSFIKTSGTSTQFLKADGSVDSSTYMVNPMTTIGDIIYGAAAGAPTRLAAGTAGQALVSAGAAAPAWTTLTLENLPDAWVKRAVKAATTANITLSAPQTIDGISVIAGDRVLVKDQTTTSQNGIYIVAAGAWTRAADADTSAEIAGATVAVDQGTTNGGTSWDTDFKSIDTIGTTGMTWFRLVDTGYTIPVSQGGTGATTLTGVMIGNGTSAVTAVAGTASQLLRRNAGNTAYEFFSAGALTKTDDTNVTLTLGGTPASALLAATSLTLGWTGQLAVGRGGTGAATLTGVVIGNGTSAMTAVAGTANQLLRRNAGNTAYEFFTFSGVTGSGTINAIPKWSGSTTSLANSNITDDGTSVVISLSVVQASATQAGTGVTSFNANNTDSSAAVTHTSRFATQQLGSGLARTLIYAASNTTGATRGQLAVLTENGGSVILQLGTSVTSSDYALSLHNIAGTEVVRLNSSGASFLNGGDVTFGTSGFYYDSINKRLGIGVASPTQVLDVAAPFAIAKFTSSTGTNAAFFQFTNTGGSFYLGLEGSASGTFGATAYAATIYTSAGVPIEFMPAATKRAELKTTGQFRLNAYTTTTSFSGTIAGYLAFDSSGNILTASAPGGSSQWTTSGSSIYYSGGTVIVGGSSATSRFNVQGGSLATNGSGIQMSADLTTGRFGAYDAGSLMAIHSWLDATGYEISAGSTSGWVSGISIIGNNAVNNPGTVRVFTASAERARWNVNGDMGLGTTSITNTANYTSLQINGTSGGLVRFSYGGTNAGHVYGSSAEVGINSASVFNVYISNSQKFNTNATEVNAYETFYARKLGAQIQLAGGVGTASGIFQSSNNLMYITDWATGTNGIALDVSNGIMYSRSSQANGAYLIFQRSGSTDYGYIGNSAQLFGAGFNGNTELGIRSAGAINFGTAGGVAIARIQTTGQLRLPLYTTATTFTGTAVGYLAFDSSGNILTTAAPSGGGITFSEVTTTTQTAAVNTGYIANNAALVTITLPATCALGSVIEIVGKGAGLWRLAQPTGDQIRFGNLSTTAGTGGYLQATHRYDSIRLVCTVADTEWTVVSVQGVIDVN